jgi:alkylated DNA repair dioxygenase AlkB
MRSCGSITILVVLHSFVLSSYALMPGGTLPNKHHATERATRCAVSVLASDDKRRRRPRASRRLSFAGKLQQARTVSQALELMQTVTKVNEVLATLEHVAKLAPRANVDHQDAAMLRRDPRLLRAISSLPAVVQTPEQTAAALWALGMIFERGKCPADVRCHANNLGDRLDEPDAIGLPPHIAAGAQWGCDTLGLDAPHALRERAKRVPFELHVGAVIPALEAIAAESAEPSALSALADELTFRRDTISSGSAQPSEQTVMEDRGTCWLSDAGHAFTYSGKTMQAAGTALTPRVAKVRDAVRGAIGRQYCSVLVNHYPDGGSGMRFHADPGQGADGGWGYSTAVVSVGETRLFIFRRADDPSVRLTYAIRHGDVLHMYGDCQEVWQHSVVRERPGGNVEGDVSQPGDAARISLVFKRSLVLEAALADEEDSAFL